MAIEFKCACGAVCRAEEVQVGHLIRCEACGLDVPVPADAEPASGGETAPAETDHAQGALEELEDIEAHAAAEQEMIEQIKEVRTEEAEKHEHDLEALKHETGDDVDEEEVRAKRQDNIAALHEQLGSRGGLAEIADQMRDVGGLAAGPGARPIAPGDLGPRTGRRPAKRPPRGKERAAHHIGFKRAIWLPSLLVGIVCLGVGVYCFFPTNGNPYARHLAYFEKTLKAAGIGEFDIVTHDGRAWAIPKGAVASPSATGRMYYRNEAAFGNMAPDELAVAADDYVAAQNHEGGEQERYLGYGVGLLVVGLALAAMSLWTLHDVRLVARDEAARRDALAAEAEEPEAAAPEETAEGDASDFPDDETPEADEPADDTAQDEADDTPADEEDEPKKE